MKDHNPPNKKDDKDKKLDAKDEQPEVPGKK